MVSRTVVGVFDTTDAARRAQLALVEAGIAENRITMSVDLTQDALAGEAPGQSYENQPGQSAHDSAAAPYSEAVRTGACVLSVEAESQAEGKRIERLMRELGARRICSYRDKEEPPERPDGSRASDVSPDRARRGATGTPLKRDATEQSRIAFLVERDGEEAAQAWVERTLEIYRKAIETKSHAATPEYRPKFEESIRAFEQWLRERELSA